MCHPHIGDGYIILCLPGTYDHLLIIIYILNHQTLNLILNKLQNTPLKRPLAVTTTAKKDVGLEAEMSPTAPHFASVLLRFIFTILACLPCIVRFFGFFGT